MSEQLFRAARPFAPRRLTASVGVSLAVAIAAAILAVAGVATPASAVTTPPTPTATAPVELLLSTDGVTFATTLTAGLFDGLGLLIPRGSTQAALWVRNPTAAPAEVRVSTHDVVLPAGGYADDVTLSAWNSGTGDTLTRTLRRVDSCGIVVPSQPIAAGGTMKLIVTFTMADVPGTVDQGASARLGLLVAMRDAVAGPFAASPCDDPGTVVPVLPGTPTTPTNSTTTPTASSTVAGIGILAHTGVEPPAPVLIVGGLLLGVGIFLLLARRRRREEDPE
ncbi:MULTISPECIES: LPXTG cell wall anchor domain-containing protein [unclassified Cryobacterium]|uniref:LPXTG cell wall anchor domain-containing protein n=1 Tax=unclassified Cryobacterium TaxID=2649013 RepID=UPI002AB41FA2|nr:MULTISPECIES: LPXTG cell wall anchor domain-containing protein [unclassified Cryobacterium]MDY7541679.1 LPXTG cell wall anchor domain-containing protein [Cryobacterium sp. 5B3]MEA9999060.1 LPXTG cell wall anchor domain-containing protein [Cryobacterium sp. RTS3]MEB0267227.1 LPXTG cell wall anchor domain-containing protein [Cryobacterium sp. 10I5]MEB0275870.1 LPXTG cell wall anchor domain-containing protein [Cryobacterium sp. 5B3]